MEQNKTEKQKIGDIGENLCVKHIVKLGHNIVYRNYRKPWGEVDVISEKDGVLHFIEVKTVGHPFYEAGDEYAPEDNIHPWKLKRLSKAIQTYLMEKDVDDEKTWQVDIAAIFLDFERKIAKIRMTFDIGL